MRTNTLLAERNQALLAQALQLLQQLPEELYSARPPHFERGGIGTHIRHVLDHYDAFLDGLDAGRIDYDARERDPRTECEISLGRARLSSTIARMGAVFARQDVGALGAQRAIQVAMELGGGPAGTRSTSQSSVGRELQYLVAHTVHHFALLAVVLRQFGHEPGPEFGVAPSTLRHEETSRGACAH